MPEDLRQLGTPIETKDGAQSKVDSHENSTSGVHGVEGSDVASTADVAEKADDPHDNAAHTTNYTDTSPSDVTSSNWGDYEIQKNGTDGNGIINFKT